MKPATLASVVENHIETTREGYDKFLLGTKSMPRTMRATGHIIDPIGTCYIKRNRRTSFYNRKIAAPVVYGLQLYDMYLLETHISRMAKIYIFEQTAKNMPYYSHLWHKVFSTTAVVLHKSPPPGADENRYDMSHSLPDGDNKHRLPLLQTCNL